MDLSKRTATRHETVGAHKNAIVSEDFADFRIGQHVMTIDGFPGVVASISDGFADQDYEVVLDHGLGGGVYRAGQLSSLPGTVAGTHEGLASGDYPELSEILVSRPDIAREH